MKEYGTPPVGPLAVGTYTEIVDIVAPSSAVADSTVNVEVKIKNLYSDYVHIYCVALPDSAFRFIDWQNAWVGPGQTQSFYGAFIMGDGDVTINAYSYFEGDDGYVHLDDSKSKKVTLAAVSKAVFSNLRATYYKNTFYNGETLVVDVTFHHTGAAYTGAKIYVAVWKRTVLDPHNEIEGLWAWSPVIVVPDDDTVGSDYTVTIGIPIRNVGGVGGATPGQYYGVLAKMTGLPFPGPDLYWFGIENDINLQAVGISEPEFSGFAIAEYNRV